MRVRVLLTLLSLALAGGAIFVLYPACSLVSPADTLETPEWFLNGLPAPSSATISSLTDSLILPIVYATKGYQWVREDSLHWQVVSVGTLDGHSVVDIVGEINCRGWSDSTKLYSHKAVKAIAIETTRGKYRLVYAAGGGLSEIYFEPSHMVEVDGTDVLYTKSRLGGQEAFYDEGCWIWDDEREVPRELQVWRAIVAVEYQLLPSDHESIHGEFNFDCMCLHGWTVRDGDDYRWPTGGYAKMQLGIERGRLNLKRASLDFSRVEQSARWKIEHSADSGYLKQPERVLEQMPIVSEQGSDWLTYEFLNGYAISPPSSVIDSLIIKGIPGLCGFHVKLDSIAANLSTQTAGSIAGHRIVAIDYSLRPSHCHEGSGRAFAVEMGPTEYRLFCVDYYVEGHWSRAEYSPSSVEGKDIIEISKRGAYREGTRSEYWVWDNERDCLVSLYHEWVLNETLTLLAPRYLPEGLAARVHLGKWDFEKLSYETYTWRAADKNGRPSGGRLKIQFGIEGKRLLPTEFTFNPSDTMIPTE